MAVNGSNPKKVGINRCPCCTKMKSYPKSGYNSLHVKTVGDVRLAQSAKDQEKDAA